MRATLFAVLCSPLLYIAGCAGGASSSSNNSIQPVQNAMPAVTLSSSSNSITAGSSVTLSWTSTNANSITISPPVAPAGVGLALNGSATVTPSASTTYVATATGSGGSAKAQVQITVNAAQQQPQITFIVTPSTIEVGASVTLTWSTQNATMVTIGGFGQQPPQGSLTVSPTVGQTYAATAWNGSLSQTASATVNVQTTQSIVAVNMAGPDNYYFTQSPLLDSLSLYGLNPSTGALTYLGGSQDSDLFNNAGTTALYTSADGRWLFVQETDGPVIEFSLTDPANFEGSRRQVYDNSAQLAGSDPASNALILFSPGQNGSSPSLQILLIDPDGSVGAAGGEGGPPNEANMPAVFDQTGKYFLLGPQLYLLSGTYATPVGAPGPNSNTVIGFDQKNTHIIAHTTTATNSGYQDQISVYNFNPRNGAITFNNSGTTIPGRGGDFNVFGFSNNVLWVLSQGVMTTYAFDPVKATLTPTGNQFNVLEGFQVPFAIDSMTNSIVEPAAQANQLNSYVVDPVAGNSRSSNGPYQAGTGPWTLAIAHVQ